MAALQKIRSRGALLIGIIGLALFAFIAQDVFNSIQTSSNEARQRVGEVNGKHITAQEFQALVEEYSAVVKFQTGQNVLSDDQLTQIKDQVWNTYVTNELIQNEANKIGLTVTDQEIQAILVEGTNPMLAQTPFRNETTGMFDVNLVKKFLSEYETIKNQLDMMSPQHIEYYQTMYNFWLFVERSLRSQVLVQKYQNIVSNSLITNPVSAKMAFEDRQQESTILLAALPYVDVSNEGITVSNSELQKKYNENKERYRQTEETRNFKYIDVHIVPSTEDREKLEEELREYAERLANGEEAERVVRESKSHVTYSTIAKRKNAFSNDIATTLDSMIVGTLNGPFYSATDNSLNVVKLINKTTLPDSIEYRQIYVGGIDVAAARATADSILAVLRAGAVFDTIAAKYNQQQDSRWLTSSQYESGTIDIENAKILDAIIGTETNSLTNVELMQGNVILQVTARKNPVQKYVAAVIKRPIQFSNETRKTAYNKFSQFVATNTTLADIELQAAQNGYRVQTRDDFSSAEHNVAGISGTQDVLRWIFDAKPGAISQLYECGNDDHMLLVAVTEVNKKGYRTLESVKAELEEEVIRDKKADMLMAKFKSVKNFDEAARLAGVITDTIRNVSFASAAYLPALGASEPVLSGSVAKTGAGAFGGPVKGYAGVYAYQVVSKTSPSTEFDAQQEESQLVNLSLRAVSRFIADLYEKANVTDTRYLFF